MKRRENKTVNTTITTEVTCDLTSNPCPDINWESGCDVPSFDYGTLNYSGGYTSKYDFLEVEMQLHPDLVAALFLMTPTGKSMLESGHWPYGLPKFKVTIEATNEN